VGSHRRRPPPSATAGGSAQAYGLPSHAFDAEPQRHVEVYADAMASPPEPLLSVALMTVGQHPSAEELRRSHSLVLSEIASGLKLHKLVPRACGPCALLA
jgi:hypothetical protein